MTRSPPSTPSLKKKYGTGLAWKNEKGEWEFWHTHYARDVIVNKRETIRHLPNPPEAFEKAYVKGEHLKYIANNLSDTDGNATDAEATKEMKDVVDKFKKKEAGTMTKQQVRVSQVESKYLLHGIPLTEYHKMVKEYVLKANFKGNIVSMVSSCDCLMQLL